jgi:hypothetical protein
MVNFSVDDVVREPRTWVTAKVIEPDRARRFIRRLDGLGYEYKVLPENRQLRILVRDRCLNDVLEWFDDLSNARTQPVKKLDSIDSRAAVGLIIALPAGMLVGSVFSQLVGIPSPISQAVSGYCGLTAAVVVYTIISSRGGNRVNP